jgi:DNA-binding transcriptional MerR regulator
MSEFQENSFKNEEIRFINGKPLYYTTSQVGQIIDETDSTIRFWCTKFKDILQIETSGKNRRFKEEDIEKLKYIKKLLREDNFSINQVIEYCSEKNSNIMETKIQNQEPMALQALATALTIEIGRQLEDYKTHMMEQFSQEMKTLIMKQLEFQEQQKEDIIGEINRLKGLVENQELQAKERDEIMINTLKKRMEEHKEEEKKEGFWSRLFHK